MLAVFFNLGVLVLAFIFIFLYDFNVIFLSTTSTTALAIGCLFFAVSPLFLSHFQQTTFYQKHQILSAISSFGFLAYYPYILQKLVCLHFGLLLILPVSHTTD
jgi:hypothetical protein